MYQFKVGEEVALWQYGLGLTRSRLSRCVVAKVRKDGKVHLRREDGAVEQRMFTPDKIHLNTAYEAGKRSGFRPPAKIEPWSSRHDLLVEAAKRRAEEVRMREELLERLNTAPPEVVRKLLHELKQLG